MKEKIKLSLMDYMCIGFVILALIGYIHSCSQDADKATQEQIEAAYTEGYAAGYYDAENGNEYDEDR